MGLPRPPSTMASVGAPRFGIRPFSWHVRPGAWTGDLFLTSTATISAACARDVCYCVDLEDEWRCGAGLGEGRDGGGEAAGPRSDSFPA